MIGIPPNEGESEQEHEKRVRATLDSKLTATAGTGGINANGGGVESGLGDGGLYAGKYNMALLRRAIRNDWPIPDEARAIAMEQMSAIVKKARNTRYKIGAAKVLVEADRVNVSRESLDQRAGITELQFTARGEEAKRSENHLHFHADGSPVRPSIAIIQREDFYGNDAHARIAQATSTPDEGSQESGTVQGGIVRAPLGQNGNGSHGGNGGTRPDSGDAQGSH